MSDTVTPAPSMAQMLHPPAAPGSALQHRHRIRFWEVLPWVLGIGYFFAFPTYLGFGNELLITILFALSLDLALGYAGIVTLGHAAFFGIGAYTVGMLAEYEIWNEPLTGLVLAAITSALVGLASGAVLLRTKGLTLLMLTLCTMLLLEESANLGQRWTGGFDGLTNVVMTPLFGVFEFNPLYPQTQYLYSLGILFIGFVVVRTISYSPFGQSLTGIRENTLRMHAVGAPVNRRLIVCYTISAAIAGVAGAVWAQANAYVNMSTFSLDRAATVLIILALGGYGRLYGAFIGGIAFMVLAHSLAKEFPEYWQLGLGLLLVVIALFARNGAIGIGEEVWWRLTGRRAVQ
ncbi:MAG: branched-chain amino acid ABC transporter permease [Hyphomicrobiales bacterium]|nr:branched-chain amino acid ABC transporter permease [Hyphomicrobiales bacterium]